MIAKRVATAAAAEAEAETVVVTQCVHEYIFTFFARFSFITILHMYPVRSRPLAVWQSAFGRLWPRLFFNK